MAESPSDDLQHGETLQRGDLAATPHSPVPEIRIHPDDTEKHRIGQTLAGRYTLLELIGRGGMSEVYKARHELLKKNMAVKLLREDVSIGKAALGRFHREAMAAASIGNPHIVDITDCGFTEGDDAFIVMELLEGKDLRQVLHHEGALAPGRAVAIVRQTLKALGAAHERSIVHRDLKAENVFLCRRDDREFVKLLDFGISKITQRGEAEQDAVRTSTGLVVGTPQYMAPEQAHGDRDVDHRVDIYAAGVMLYEMLTGELPFSGKSALDVMMKHVQETPQSPRERRPDLDIPVALEQIALKAMSKDREQRYATANQMLEALPASSSLPGGYSSTVRAVVARRPRRWPFLILVGGLFALGAVVFQVAIPGPSPAPSGDATATVAVAADAGWSEPDTAEVADAASSADQAAPVTLEIVVAPGHAGIYIGDQRVGVGRWKGTVPRGGDKLEFVLRAPGYRDRRIELLPDRNRAIDLRLTRRRSKGGTSPKAPAGPTDLRGNPYLKGQPRK